MAVPDPSVLLPPQQHVLLLLHLPHRPHSLGEVGGVTWDEPQYMYEVTADRHIHVTNYRIGVSIYIYISVFWVPPLSPPLGEGGGVTWERGVIKK